MELREKILTGQEIRRMVLREIWTENRAPPDGEGGPGGPGGPGGQNSAPESYDAVSSFSEDKEESDQTYASTGKDESAVLVTSGASVTLNNFTIDRTSTDSTGGDNSSFYGHRRRCPCHRRSPDTHRRHDHHRRERRCRHLQLRQCLRIRHHDHHKAGHLRRDPRRRRRNSHRFQPHC